MFLIFLLSSMFTSPPLMSMQNNKSDAQINWALGTVCMLAPMDFGECMAVLSKDLDKLVDMLKKGATPDEICEALAICPKFGVQLEVKSPKCEVCKVITGWLLEEVKVR